MLSTIERWLNRLMDSEQVDDLYATLVDLLGDDAAALTADVWQNLWLGVTKELVRTLYAKVTHERVTQLAEVLDIILEKAVPTEEQRMEAQKAIHAEAQAHIDAASKKKRRISRPKLQPRGLGDTEAGNPDAATAPPKRARGSRRKRKAESTPDEGPSGDQSDAASPEDTTPAPRKKGKSSQACTLCGENGHNKRSCPKKSS